MSNCLYVGLDVHKKSISFCAKWNNGTVFSEGKIAARREELKHWAASLEYPWVGAMEATMFTGWIYDFLSPYAEDIKVAHPRMLKAIAASKKKNDRVDASRIADCLRADLLPECYMAPRHIREMRRELRFRNVLVGGSVRMKNKMAGVLMEVGAEYEKPRLHYKKYFSELLGSLDPEIATESVKRLLSSSRAHVELFQAGAKSIVSGLKKHPALEERVKRLMTCPGVGEILSLTWALEIGDPHRFRTVGQMLSYCGLTSGQSESGGKSRRMPISKQRNKNLQWVLCEAAKLAPRYYPHLKELYEKELARGNRNRATLAVARKIASYLYSVDKNNKPYEDRTMKK